MSALRFYGALALGAAVMILTIVLAWVYCETDIAIFLTCFSYGFGAMVVNTIWLQGAMISVAMFAISILAAIWSFFISFWIICIFFIVFFLSASVAVIGIALFVMCVVAAVTLPFNIANFSQEIY
jgi:hypothetical protein